METIKDVLVGTPEVIATNMLTLVTLLLAMFGDHLVRKSYQFFLNISIKRQPAPEPIPTKLVVLARNRSGHRF